MKTKTSASATQTNPSNKEKKAKKQLDKANVAKNALKVIPRDSKYLYPEDVKTAADKKKFRRNARALRSKFEKDIKILSKSKEAGHEKDLKALQKEQATFMKETYAHPAE